MTEEQSSRPKFRVENESKRHTGIRSTDGRDPDKRNFTPPTGSTGKVGSFDSYTPAWSVPPGTCEDPLRGNGSPPALGGHDGEGLGSTPPRTAEAVTPVPSTTSGPTGGRGTGPPTPSRGCRATPTVPEETRLGRGCPGLTDRPPLCGVQVQNPGKGETGERREKSGNCRVNRGGLRYSCSPYLSSLLVLLAPPPIQQPS